MNDDLEAAEDGLKEGTSSFHKLAKAMIAFLRAALGFEPEIMRLASERLADAEAQATSDLRRAQRDPKAYHSAIYPVGSEFALCQAESQIMGAVVGVLNENLMESIKGFYKLRKAYMTLDGILEAESRQMRKLNGESVKTPSIRSARRTSFSSLRSKRSLDSTKGMPGGFDEEKPKRAEPQTPSAAGITEHRTLGSTSGLPSEDKDDDSDEFVDADEALDDVPMPETYLGTVEVDGVTTKLENTTLERRKSRSHQELSSPIAPITPKTPRNHLNMLNHDPDSEIFTNVIDVFIHSGANLCFGLLLILISMIPPAFSRLLFIIGFKGDRDRGVRMLWQASKFHNANGAIAGLIILGFYNALIGFCDIIVDSKSAAEGEEESLAGYPTKKLDALLADMRTRYPKSQLWLLEEARMQSCKRELNTAIKLLSGPKKSTLKQVEALSMFEKSLCAMNSHRYALCAESFVTCTTLNNWSHALYFYIAGSCYVELYRLAKASSDPAEKAKAEEYAKQASDYLHKKVRSNAGKKKFMARQLPFDVFVVRKLNKWEARAKEFDVPLIDAIGVSPIEEMIYFWNGYKKMNPVQLKESLERLSWSKNTTFNPTWEKESPDERTILSVLEAATLRNLGEYSSAKSLLEKEVLHQDKSVLKGGNSFKDNWTLPVANYEMAVNLWLQRSRGSSAEEEARDSELVTEAESWIERVSKWESYELDARIGLKVATAQETLKKWREGYSGGVGSR
ncbi:MAG: Mitochondrial outer membrane protein iml2 [Icmadophila ericetorum]|nr:Mitochondrial outer membrane protein iml2 [Icmadophila ericetorum]